MRSSIFTIPAQINGATTSVNSPVTTFPALTYSTGTVDLGNTYFTTQGNADAARSLPYIGIAYTLFTQGTTTQVGNGTIRGVSGSDVLLTPSTSTPLGGQFDMTVQSFNRANPVPTGSTVIPVLSTTGLAVGDKINPISNVLNVGATIVAIGTTSTISGATSPAITIDRATTGPLTDGTSIVEPNQSGVVIYPIDQYVAPVEVSIQNIVGPTSASQVLVQASVLPLSELDGPNSVWFAYVPDTGTVSGSAYLPTGNGQIVTYANKVITAFRFTNTGSAVTIALAEAGIIT